jgi:hypothetical protein
MIKVTVTYEVYEYDELSEEAQNEAMEQFINIVIPVDESALDIVDKNRKITLKEYMWEVHKRDDNVSDILRKEFKFNKDGTALSKRVCDEANVIGLKQE